MYNYLYSAILDRSSVSDESARLEDLKYFCREDRDLDVQIRSKFPIDVV